LAPSYRIEVISKQMDQRHKEVIRFKPNTIYIIGFAKSQLNNPITHQFGRFLLGFVIDKDSGRIETCGSSVVMPSTYDFLNELFTGKNILEDGELISYEVENRYFGASQKAILVAFRDAQRRYKLFSQGVREGLTRQEDFTGKQNIKY
jgi:hypothetical protein